MPLTFLVPFRPPTHHPPPCRTRWTCSTKPPSANSDNQQPDPQPHRPDSNSQQSHPPAPDSSHPPTHGLSSLDQQYVQKVRAKLFNARQTIETARAWSDTPVPSVDSDDAQERDVNFIADLPDDLDHIDDIIYERGPNNTNQVRLFGAWLDESVAGRKATDPTVVSSQAERKRNNSHNSADTSIREDEQFDPQSFHKISLTKGEALQLANDTFATAMTAFNKGQYKEAVTLYAHAVDYVGVQSRLGGQYQLWHAQALDAAGDKEQAAAILESLRMHSDPDVRKVSRELLFIITAPKLELEPGTFLDIPALEDDARPARIQTALTSSYGPLRTALMEKPPERYSLEWYMEKERPPKVKDHSRMDLVLVTAAIFVTLAVMVTTSPT